MKVLYSLFIFLAAMSVSAQLKRQMGVLTDGVSLELAQLRKQQISAISYELAFDIPANKQEDIMSKLKLQFHLSDLDNPLYLDFNVESKNIKAIEVNGTNTSFRHEKGHIIIEPGMLQQGNNMLTVSFIAGDLSLNRSEDYLYTLLVPDRASTVFPCFDQPDLKAVYSLTLTVPASWFVLSGAAVKTREEKGDFTVYHFDSTDKMSTYLFSFTAGNFKSISSKSGKMPMTMLYRETDQQKINASTDMIFKLHEDSVDFLQRYTGIGFPFQKLDFAAIPGFQYGGMEHVGNVQYRESLLFLDRNATDTEKLERAKLVAHETAHMWFGDLITMKWFDDVWMKEVFANFMADKIMNPLFPTINHNLQFFTDHYDNAYSEDRSMGTHPIRQKLENLSNAGSLYGSIIYNKAPIMMRQLEALMGRDVFQKGISEYLQKYAGGNADWNDLVKILDKQTPINLRKWSEVWVNKPGRAVFTAEINYDSHQNISSFEIKQQAEDKSANIWPQKFKIGLVYPDHIKIEEVSIQKEKTLINSLKGLPKPLAVLYNYDGFGYGVFPIEEQDLEMISTLGDETARASCYSNVYENILTGRISPLDAFDCFFKGIMTEQNELVLNLACDNLSSIFWNFMTQPQQEKVQKKLEKMLYARLEQQAPSNIKKTIYNLFSAISFSDQGKETLYQIWSRQLTISGLTLNEDDYTALAMNLAIYGHANSDAILKKTREGLTNKDKQKRFDYLLPSLSQEQSVRDSFMESLKEAKNREIESWTLRGLANVHHPLRQKGAEKYLRLCLDLTAEIQRTGDIFFPQQ